MIRINKNESPYRALTEKEIGNIAVKTLFNQYADDEYESLQASYAAFNQLDPECVAFANGSDEWIQKAMILFQDGPVMILDPDFVMYEEYARQFNRPLIRVACREDFTFDHEAVLKRIEEDRPAVFIFSQPNNPFGTLHPLDFIEEAAEAMERVGGYFIIDEAYAEFLEVTDKYPEGDHIIRFRTLSKVYGLAGLRVGVAIATKQTMSILNSIAHPYPLNTFSLNVANYLLNQPERLTDFIEINRQLSKKLVRIFDEEVGDTIDRLGTCTNFLFTYGEAAMDLGQYVVENGFMPRLYPESELPSLKQAVRYSIASDEDLDKLRLIIRKWREENDY